MVFYEEEWNYNLCTMVTFTQEQKDVFYVKCDCSVSGFIGVGMVIEVDNQIEVIPGSIDVIYHYVQEVSFK